MKIKDIPKFNRPGFKLTRKGVNTLDDAELLSIIFGVGGKGESALELSNKLLKKYNFNKLEELSIKDLAKECKWNYNKALQILSLIEICKRYNKFVNNGFTKNIKSAEDVFNIYSYKFINEKKENFIALCLDSKNNIIKEEPVSIGILDSSLVHPREVFKPAIKESAYAIILIHNHPSGDPTPSKQDIEVTRNLMKSGETLNIPVLDHVIIGKNSYFSFKERAD
ncbi:MAG: DNA repair protein RadC [Nanoarchaeota archaeon]|nr:DNA repair protein RadC [Nanoarchaeota archaeon]